MISKIFAKLRDPEYRKAFVASQINIGIPFQIRALLKARGWTQEELAERTGMLQPRISALLSPGKVRPNIETLRRIAEAFDCVLQVRFVPFTEQVRWSESFNPEKFSVPSFDEEIAQIEQWEDTTVAALEVPAKAAYTTTVEAGTGMVHYVGDTSLIPGIDLGTYALRRGVTGKASTELVGVNITGGEIQLAA